MRRNLGPAWITLLGFAFACGGSIAAAPDGGTPDAGSGSSSGITGSSSGASSSSSGVSSSSSSGSTSSSSSGGSGTCIAYAGPGTCSAGDLACGVRECCPPNLPFKCPGMGNCFADENAAFASCTSACAGCYGSTSIVDSGPPDVAMCANGTITVLGVDGGENTACEQQIAINCGIPQCMCTADSALFFTDSGAIPGCALYVECVYAELTLLTPDAGPAAALGQAQADCAASTGASASSVSLGEQFYNCLASSQSTFVACLP